VDHSLALLHGKYLSWNDNNDCGTDRSQDTRCKDIELI